MKPLKNQGFPAFWKAQGGAQNAPKGTRFQRLEISLRATARGFESHRLRQSWQ